MKFPYPENPSDWQTAYTRDDAYNESERRAIKPLFGTLLLLIAILFTVVSTFLALDLLPFSLHPYIKLAIGLIPLAVVILAFYRTQKKATGFASAFLTDFYQPPEGIDPSKIIASRLSGKSRLPPPLNLFATFDYILVKEGAILKANEWPGWSAKHIGGPILLIVFDGCALYLERGNRFSRVVGPGDKIPFLEWYETIKYVVDLRPKVKADEISVWTKDGINIKLKIQVECRIGDPKHYDPDYPNLVYPYDPTAVKKAVERYSLRWPMRADAEPGEPAEFTWVDAVWGQVTGIVPTYIGSRMLDDLFIADRNKGQILSPTAYQDIFGKLNAATQVFGVYVTDFQVMEIKFPKEVIEAQHDQWRVEKQRIATRNEGETKAFHIRTREKAKADAQHDIILAIAEGLEKNQEGRFIEPLLLSLSGILDESLSEPLTRAYLAKQTLDTLEQLQKLLEHPLGSSEKKNAEL
jgi:regulator of protease activity HflC (stomatin/prohibitin superfamily)